ncbi:MAG: hypothetical protein Q9220_003587 [cf. Caloplaca sp. 1 TL-2023]
MPQTIRTTLYILYNADASILGKLNYAYRKLSSEKDKPACAACDITHGGLRLDETKAWKGIKDKLTTEEGLEIKQLHRDELDGKVKEFMQGNEGVEYPVVLAGDEPGGLRVAMDRHELGACSGSADAFVGKLREKEVLGSGKSLSSSL